MDKNEIKTIDDVIAQINEEVAITRTIVTHKRDDSTDWMDIDDDPKAEKTLKFAQIIAILGMLVLDDWDSMKGYFSEEMQNQVKDVVYLFNDEQEQPNTNEE